MFKTRTMLFAGALAASLTVGAMASDNSVNEQLKALRAELDAVRVSNTQLQGQVSQLRSASDENWLNERRAQEVRSLVKEVLADADTRASLLEGGMSAGHNGKNFFLASEDGSFNMKLGGQLQFRYIWHQQDQNSTTADNDDMGFQFRRMKFNVKGHIGSPKITYALVLSGARDTGAVKIQDAKMGYKFGNGFAVNFGKYKIPFLREELTSSSRQLAVDRSIVTEYFTLDRSEQVELTYSGSNYKLAVSLNDGADEEFSTIGSDPADFAIAARGDIALMGNLKQIKDFTTWSKDDTGLFLGGAIFYQAGDGNNADNSSESSANYMAWTIDGSYESNGFSLYAAYMGSSMEYDNAVAGTDRDPSGFLVQAGYHIIPDTLEPFVRWETIDGDVATEEEMQAVTFGLNWYLKKHNAKFTTDLVWVYEGDEPTTNPWGNSEFSDGLGFSGDDSGSAQNDDIFIWRAQFQLLF